MDSPTQAISFINTIQHGDCLSVMRQLPAGSVDFVLTDPPYITRYRDRTGRRVANDDNEAWLAPAYAQMHRVLKNNAFAISFYGWNKADAFMAAWKKAGFRVAGHLVFRKRYASKAAYLRYRHEMACLLVKGHPAFPASPLDDVRDWSYSGNSYHPTQKSTAVLRPLIESFSRPGDIVLDPFAGSGSSCVAALQTKRRYIGIELAGEHHATADKRLAAALARRAA